MALIGSNRCIADSCYKRAHLDGAHCGSTEARSRVRVGLRGSAVLTAGRLMVAGRHAAPFHTAHLGSQGGGAARAHGSRDFTSARLKSGSCSFFTFCALGLMRGGHNGECGPGTPCHLLSTLPPPPLLPPTLTLKHLPPFSRSRHRCKPREPLHAGEGYRAGRQAAEETSIQPDLLCLHSLTQDSAP